MFIIASLIRARDKLQSKLDHRTHQTVSVEPNINFRPFLSTQTITRIYIVNKWMNSLCPSIIILDHLNFVRITLRLIIILGDDVFGKAIEQTYGSSHMPTQIDIRYEVCLLINWSCFATIGFIMISFHFSIMTLYKIEMFIVVVLLLLLLY